MNRGVNGGWAEWEISHPGFGSIVMQWLQRQRAALLFAHLALRRGHRSISHVCNLKLQKSGLD